MHASADGHVVVHEIHLCRLIFIHLSIYLARVSLVNIAHGLPLCRSDLVMAPSCASRAWMWTEAMVNHGPVICGCLSKVAKDTEEG